MMQSLVYSLSRMLPWFWFGDNENLDKENPGGREEYVANWTGQRQTWEAGKTGKSLALAAWRIDVHDHVTTQTNVKGAVSAIIYDKD